MDYNKIGCFIASERKAKKLTQEKLAEKIFVSEKTISKWENGNGVPDTNSLVKLCEVFNVSINELLCGERFVEDNKERNEELLLSMAKDLELKDRTIWKSMWVIMIFSITALLLTCLAAAYLVASETWKLILVIFACCFFLIPCFYALKLEVSIGAYKCKKCGHEIVPTYKEALNSMHRGTTRYLKCPNCNKRTWCKKVLKKK